MLVDAGWQWPVWLPDGGAGRSGQGWITPEQGTRSAPEENKSATVITHRQSHKDRDCFPIAQNTIFKEFAWLDPFSIYRISFFFFPVL